MNPTRTQSGRLAYEQHCYEFGYSIGEWTHLDWTFREKWCKVADAAGEPYEQAAESDNCPKDVRRAYAMAALTGLLAGQKSAYPVDSVARDSVARNAFQIAKAMIAREGVYEDC